MANLLSSAVTTLTGRFDRQPGRCMTVRSFDLVLTGHGAAGANKITAAVLGFTKILESSVGILGSDANLVVTSPSLDGSFLMLKASATDAPADLTGTLRVTVGGNV